MAETEVKSVGIEVNSKAKEVRFNRAIDSIIKIATSNAKSGIDVFDFKLDGYKGMNSPIISTVFERTLGTVATSSADVNYDSIRFYIVKVNR